MWEKQVTKIHRKLQRILGIVAQRKALEILLKKQDFLLVFNGSHGRKAQDKTKGTVKLYRSFMERRRSEEFKQQ